MQDLSKCNMSPDIRATLYNLPQLSFCRLFLALTYEENNISQPQYPVIRILLDSLAVLSEKSFFVDFTLKYIHLSFDFFDKIIVI